MTELVPQLSVRGGAAALAFYAEAFGAEVVFQIGGTTADEPVVAQLRIGSASFWVADESPADGNFSPLTVGGGTVRMLLQVDDPEAVVARAVAAGATLTYPVADDNHWLLGRILDPYGHSWEIGRPLVPWPPGLSG